MYVLSRFTNCEKKLEIDFNGLLPRQSIYDTVLHRADTHDAKVDARRPRISRI